MKKLIFLVLIALSFYPKITFSNDLIGPKIYNLQLGMSYNEARPIIEEICDKFNIKCKDYIDQYDIRYYNGNVKSFGYDAYPNFLNITYDNDVIVKYMLPLKIFNFSIMKTDKKVFLQEIANHYGLSLTCKDNDNSCEYKNTDIGFQVNISIPGEWIAVKKIQTQSDLQFK